MDNQTIPPQAWKRSFTERPIAKPSGMKLTLPRLFQMLPIVWRISSASRKARKEGREPVLDLFAGYKPGANLGVPLGGLGGGTITRGWRGDFNRFQMAPGRYQYGRVPANAFSLWVQHLGSPAQSIVLSPDKPEKGA
jgi:non-lysosomal glucosylceramidase